MGYTCPSISVMDTILPDHHTVVQDRIAGCLPLERIFHPNDREIDPVVRLLDTAVRKMLDFQPEIKIVAKDISRSYMVAELEPCREPASVVVI